MRCSPSVDLIDVWNAATFDDELAAHLRGAAGLIRNYLLTSRRRDMRRPKHDAQVFDASSSHTWATVRPRRTIPRSASLMGHVIISGRDQDRDCGRGDIGTMRCVQTRSPLYRIATSRRPAAAQDTSMGDRS